MVAAVADNVHTAGYLRPKAIRIVDSRQVVGADDSGSDCKFRDDYDRAAAGIASTVP
ncbi:hypothetical protein DZS_22250 [Dickeya ananatis]